MIHNCKSKIILLIILGNLKLAIANAQPQFYSESLKNLYNLMPETCKQDPSFICKEIVLSDTVKINYQIDECGVIVHIGYKFINLADSLVSNRPILQFLEREFLKWIISNSEDEILVEYEIDKIFVKYKNNPINAQFLKNKRNLIKILNSSNELIVNRINHNYSVKISNSGNNKIEITFPNDPKLITGMNMKERDALISNQLKLHQILKPRNYKIDSTNIKPVNDSIFIQNGSYYLIPAINNDVFVQRKDSLFQVILDKEYMNETFINTMLGLSSKDYKYNIKQVKYGYNIENYEVSSKCFYDYFSSNYHLYFGIKTCYKDYLSGILIIQDKDTDYIHFASIKCTVNDLLNDNNIEVELYTNIPRSSIKNLFGELDDNE